MEKYNNENYGQTDPDFIDQETLIDNDNYKKEEDPYEQQYRGEFIGDVNHETNDNIRNENIPNEERIINEDGLITNDEEKDTEYVPDDVDDHSNRDDDGEEHIDDDLDEMDDFEAEHFPETHPRE
jgi:hypothetical protein